MKDGLPQSSVNDIIQTKDSYIWLATYGGLVRFDGESFTTFDRSNTKGMRSDRILSLFEDSHGAIWLCTEDGFLRFKNGECSSFLILQESQIYAPLKVTEDSSGVLWITVNSKIYRFNDSTFVQVPIIQNTDSSHTEFHHLAGNYLGHGKEIFSTSGDSVFQVVKFDQVLKNNIQDVVEFPKGSGIFFFATSGSGIGRYDHGKTTFFTEKDGLSSVFVRKLYIDKENNLWGNYFNGLSKWDGTRFVPFTPIKIKTELEYTDILEDNEGNYWIGTPSRGLFKVRPAAIFTIGVEQGLKNDKMLSMMKLNDGKILFATNCGGIYEWKNNRATYSSVNSFLPNLCVWSVFQDSKNRIWFGSRTLYMTTDLNKRGKNYDLQDGKIGNEVFAITEDRKGNIWIGSLNGVFIFDGQNFKKFTTADGLSYNDTRTLYEDKNGVMWIGTSAGLNTFQNGKIKQIKLRETEKDSLRSEPYIRAIHEEPEGTMWLGSYGDGLIRIKNVKITFISVKDGLFDNIVSHIVEDESGNYWMGSNRGISRVSKYELNDFCDGKRNSVHAFSYGIADGMQSAETNGGFQPNMIYDQTGVIYFPTVNGVVNVATRNVQENTVPPPVLIEKLLVDGTTLPNNDMISLPHDSASLEIRFTALSFSEPNKVRFKYKLSGLNDTWFDAGNRRSAFYSKIPPGDYIFHVIACNEDGLWNVKGASLKIYISPPFWKTRWFLSIVILFFLIFGPYLFYYRITKLKKEKSKQEEFAQRLIDSQERERRRIAAELHDGLGQQILVIKNRAEMALLQVTNPDKITEQLNEIIGSAMSSISDVRAISHDLRPVHLEQFGLTETILNLCDQLKSTTEIEWNYYVDDIDGTVPKAKEINFYRIIQEATNNILNHSQANKGSIIVRRNDKNVIVLLWDDGIGFDVNRKKKSGGLGLSGIDERVKTLNGIFEIQSGSENGTQLKITIPIHDYEK